MLKHLDKYCWLLGLIVIFVFCLTTEAIKEILYVGIYLSPIFFLALYLEHRKK